MFRSWSTLQKCWAQRQSSYQWPSGYHRQQRRSCCRRPRHAIVACKCLARLTEAFPRSVSWVLPRVVLTVLMCDSCRRQNLTENIISLLYCTWSYETPCVSSVITHRRTSTVRALRPRHAVVPVCTSIVPVVPAFSLHLNKLSLSQPPFSLLSSFDT